MKSYLDQRGVYHRTQSEAKASGFPFEMVDIPTDHASLIDFVNRLSVPVPAPSTMEEFISQHAVVVRAPEGDPELRAAYQNGDLTVPFMGSRDPRAIFTCINCGKDNSNGRS